MIPLSVPVFCVGREVLVVQAACDVIPLAAYADAVTLGSCTHVGRWCGSAQSISLLVGDHASLALTFCHLCNCLYPGRLRINCFNIWISCRYKQLTSLQGSVKLGLRSSALHGMLSTLSRRHRYLSEEETCNSDSKVSVELLQTHTNRTLKTEIERYVMATAGWKLRGWGEHKGPWWHRRKGTEELTPLLAVPWFHTTAYYLPPPSFPPYCVGWWYVLDRC